MKNIGLLLTRNEIDVSDEVMQTHERYFSHILALDGSDDGTYERL